MSKVIAVRLSDSEWNAFLGACEKHNVNKQQFLHAVVVDALVDEGFDALRCEQSSGCENGSETGEGSGATAT